MICVVWRTTLNRQPYWSCQLPLFPRYISHAGSFRAPVEPMSASHNPKAKSRPVYRLISKAISVFPVVFKAYKTPDERTNCVPIMERIGKWVTFQYFRTAMSGKHWNGIKAYNVPKVIQRTPGDHRYNKLGENKTQRYAAIGRLFPAVLAI